MGKKTICDLCGADIEKGECFTINLLPPRSFNGRGKHIRTWDVCRECLDFPISGSKMRNVLRRLIPDFVRRLWKKRM